MLPRGTRNATANAAKISYMYMYSRNMLLQFFTVVASCSIGIEDHYNLHVIYRFGYCTVIFTGHDMSIK